MLEGFYGKEQGGYMFCTSLAVSHILGAKGLFIGGLNVLLNTLTTVYTRV